MKLLFVTILSLAILSCGKNKCKDDLALNNNEKGSCVYEFKSTIYFDSQTRNSLILNEIDSLKYFLNGVDTETEESIYLEKHPELGYIKPFVYREESVQKTHESMRLVITHETDTIWSLNFKPRIEYEEIIKLEY